MWYKKAKKHRDQADRLFNMAQEKFSSAISANPNNPEALYSLGKLLKLESSTKNSKDSRLLLEQAEKLLKRACKIQGLSKQALYFERADVLIRIASFYSEKTREYIHIEKAQKCFSDLNRVDPKAFQKEMYSKCISIYTELTKLHYEDLDTPLFGADKRKSSCRDNLNADQIDKPMSMFVRAYHWHELFLEFHYSGSIIINTADILRRLGTFMVLNDVSGSENIFAKAGQVFEMAFHRSKLKCSLGRAILTLETRVTDTCTSNSSSSLNTPLNSPNTPNRKGETIETTDKPVCEGSLKLKTSHRKVKLRCTISTDYFSFQKVEDEFPTRLRLTDIKIIKSESEKAFYLVHNNSVHTFQTNSSEDFKLWLDNFEKNGANVSYESVPVLSRSISKKKNPTPSSVYLLAFNSTKVKGVLETYRPDNRELVETTMQFRLKINNSNPKVEVKPRQLIPTVRTCYSKESAQHTLEIMDKLFTLSGTNFVVNANLDVAFCFDFGSVQISQVDVKLNDRGSSHLHKNEASLCLLICPEYPPQTFLESFRKCSGEEELKHLLYQTSDTSLQRVNFDVIIIHLNTDARQSYQLSPKRGRYFWMKLIANGVSITLHQISFFGMLNGLVDLPLIENIPKTYQKEDWFDRKKSPPGSPPRSRPSFDISTSLGGTPTTDFNTDGRRSARSEKKPRAGRKSIEHKVAPISQTVEIFHGATTERDYKKSKQNKHRSFSDVVPGTEAKKNVYGSITNKGITKSTVSEYNRFPFFTSLFSSYSWIASLFRMVEHSPSLREIIHHIVAHHCTLQEKVNLFEDVLAFHEYQTKQSENKLYLPIANETSSPDIIDMNILNFNGSKIINKFVVEEFIRCSQCQYVDLSYTSLVDADMSGLLNKMGSNLISLRLKGCSKLGDHTMNQIVANCINLRHLGMWNTASEFALGQISQLEKIEYLDLSMCTITTSLFSSLNPLKYLDLSLCECKFDPKALVRWFKKRNVGPSVEGLIFRRYEYIKGIEQKAKEDEGAQIFNDDIVPEIVIWCTNLRILNLENCVNVNSMTLHALKECVKLESLNLNGIQNLEARYLQSLLEATPQLRNFELHFRGAGEENNKILATGLGFLYSLTSLTLKHLSLNDEIKPVVLANSRKLVKLDLSRSNFSHSTALAISACSSLVELRLQGCSHISEEAIASISENCQKIVILGLEGCRGVTNKSLHNFLKPNKVKKSLHTLLLDGCELPTPECFKLIERNTELRVLSLKFCPWVTIDDVLSLAKSLHRLEKLDISCPILAKHDENFIQELLVLLPTTAIYLQ
eukprot:TRINITY_DN7881_c0_g2_i1.p1 TRINITY_DN7881_c0_g2~~TRINITY_DN7881_c0_g2_i1.p1  ORF type:complete len:1419 (-),score=325.99 TRINITY_DN7881_c0_g2_i1:59-3943(-)